MLTSSGLQETRPARLTAGAILFLEMTLNVLETKCKNEETQPVVIEALKQARTSFNALINSMGQLSNDLFALTYELNGADMENNPKLITMLTESFFPELVQQLFRCACIVEPINKRTEKATTTAIYANRIQDKEELEHRIGIAEIGNETTVFRTPKGTTFAVGYERIVYGDHGPYIEFRKDQIRCSLNSKFKNPCPPTAFFEWLCPTDGSGIKVYDQKRDVRHLKNPPPGGFNGNRAEGYADYRVGFIYVDPYALSVRSGAT